MIRILAQVQYPSVDTKLIPLVFSNLGLGAMENLREQKNIRAVNLNLLTLNVNKYVVSTPDLNLLFIFILYIHF